MHKITGQTTTGELMVLRAMFGVEQLKLDVNPGRGSPHAAIATLITADITCVGTGETDIEALDDAFARLQHRIGSVALSTQPCTPPLKPRAVRP